MKKVFSELKITAKYLTIFFVGSMTIQGTLSTAQKPWVQVAIGGRAVADELVFSGNATKPAHPNKKPLKLPKCITINGQTTCAGE